jgi:hypothetical protein
VRRIAAIAMLTTVALGAVTGFAASLNVSSDQLGSGPADITSCDTDGVHATYNQSLGLVVAVVVTDIDDGSTTIGSGACDGETVHVEALDGDGDVLTGAIGSRTNNGDLDAVENVVTVPLTVPPLASLVEGVRITITG